MKKSQVYQHNVEKQWTI